MDWSPGYRESEAPVALRAALACLWVRVVPPEGAPPLVLPDACADLIWRGGRGAFIAGPDTGPALEELPPGTILVGARFRPGAGGPALGVPLSELRDQRVDLANLSRGLARRLPVDLEPDEALRRVTEMSARLAAEGQPDSAVVQAARLLRDPRRRTEDVADGLGLSERQLRRRCHAAVGYGPKTLQRVLRFRRFVSRIDASGGLARVGDLATIAVEAGYADQAHLTRESARLAGLTPAALARVRITG